MFIINYYIFSKNSQSMLKRKFNRFALILAILVTIYFLYVYISTRFSNQPGFTVTSNGYAIILPVQDTAFRNAFFQYDIDDSLPHYQFRKLEDSFKRIQFDIDRQNKGYLIKSSFHGFVGFTKLRNPQKLEERKQAREQLVKIRVDSIKQVLQSVKNPDSIQRLMSLEKAILENWAYSKNNEIYKELSPGDFDYFLTLQGYRLPENERFFVQNGRYYIAYPGLDTTTKKGAEELVYYKRKQVPVRHHETENTISIPLSKFWYNLLNSIAFILIILFFIASFYITLGLPASILVSISKGRAFTKQNIKDMKTIYWFLLGYGVLKTIYPFLEEWIFSKYITGNFISTTGLNSFFSSLPLLLSGLAVLLVCKAFQNGYKMQQEQDLTV